MADGRRNNGGHSTKGYAGRKTKADELKVSSFALSAMKEVFGSEQEAWKSLATQAADSYNHMRLLFEYAYGKPKETLDVNTTGGEPFLTKEQAQKIGKILDSDY